MISEMLVKTLKRNFYTCTDNDLQHARQTC